MIGQLIGERYLVTGVLGEGGMGVVYVGEQRMGSGVRKVAIKTLHPDVAADPSLVARFHRECGTVALLEHPNTIQFYDFGSTAEGALYIAMEFVEGRPLSDLIAQETLSSARTLNILRQLCGALQEAHAGGIIHRDLKPDNVILTHRGQEPDFVKLIDFGIAARTAASAQPGQPKLTAPGTILGTPQYMSPEQFSGRELDARSDIYSLAVMAYEMLTGCLPFVATTPIEWAMKHLTALPTPLEEAAPAAQVPRVMQATIMRALSKDRDLRPPTVSEFFRELSTEDVSPQVLVDPASAPSSAVAPVSPTVPDGVASEKPPTSARSSVRLVAVALAILVPVLAVAVVFASARRPHRRDGSALAAVDSTPAQAQVVAPASNAQAVLNTNPLPSSPTGVHGASEPTLSTHAPPDPSGAASASRAGACDACIAAAEAGNAAEVAINLALCSEPERRVQCLAVSKKQVRAQASSFLPPLRPRPLPTASASR